MGEHKPWGVNFGVFYTKLGHCGTKNIFYVFFCLLRAPGPPKGPVLAHLGPIPLFPWANKTTKVDKHPPNGHCKIDFLGPSGLRAGDDASIFFSGPAEAE